MEDPTARRADSYRALVAEFVERGEDLVPFPLQFEHTDFDAFLARMASCSRGEGIAPGFVAHSTFWLVRDNQDVVGVSNLRHALTDSLRREGGHVGYGVRPSARGNGYATELLRQTLARAERLGLDRVLVTCDKDNEASARVILRNGGVLDSEEFLTKIGGILQRYWISIPYKSTLNSCLSL